MSSYGRFINELNVASLMLRRKGICRDVRRIIVKLLMFRAFADETTCLRREMRRRYALVRGSVFTLSARRMKARACFWIRTLVEVAPDRYPDLLGDQLRLNSFRRRGFDWPGETTPVRYEWRWTYRHVPL